MVGRRKIKKEHEQFHVKNFLDWFNKAYKSDFKVIGEPDPPEAIIRSSATTTRWIEISTAFWNVAYARDLNSYANPYEDHKPIKKGSHLDMDSEFANNFINVLVKKLEKKSYLEVKKKYGAGYLVIPIYFPFLDKFTISLMKEEWANRVYSDLGCFRSIRICYKNLNEWVFYRWPKN